VDFTFPSSHRIRQSKEFVQAFSNKGLTNKWFIVYIINNNHQNPRLGMVVSKRIMPKAVSRNFAKRLIREVFRQNANNLPERDFFVKIRRSLSKSTSNEAKVALSQLLLGSVVS
jgi:ribonuclease P protein component